MIGRHKIVGDKNSRHKKATLSTAVEVNTINTASSTDKFLMSGGFFSSRGLGQHTDFKDEDRKRVHLEKVEV